MDRVKDKVAIVTGGSSSIVNLSSIYGIISAEDISPYHASKGAVRLMTKTDALYYAADDIRVHAVQPGFIWTPLVENMAKESPEGEGGARQPPPDRPRERARCHRLRHRLRGLRRIEVVHRQ